MTEKNKPGVSEVKPSVGRIVLFKEHNTLNIVPAIITRVHGDEGCVNLLVFPDCGTPYVSTSVAHSPEPQDGAWSWPVRE